MVHLLLHEAQPELLVPPALHEGACDQEDGDGDGRQLGEEGHVAAVLLGGGRGGQRVWRHGLAERGWAKKHVRKATLPRRCPAGGEGGGGGRSVSVASYFHIRQGQAMRQAAGRAKGKARRRCSSGWLSE